MLHRNWVKRLEDELAKQGVPARFRHRLVAELQDHADDLRDTEGLTMTDDLMVQRLGDPTELAQQEAKQTRAATWVGRHPVLVFALSPLPIGIVMLVLSEIVIGLLLAGIAAVSYGSMENIPRSTVVTMAYTSAYALRYVPFILLTAFFTRLYTRHHVSRRMFAVAVLQILVVAGCFISEIHYSDIPGQSQFIVGLAFLPNPWVEGWRWPLLSHVGVTQLAQMLVPCAVCAFFLWLARRRESAFAAC